MKKLPIKYELSLEELRRRELAILRHFRDYCRRENITWCLANGSLLGAVKYGGFIPWDDDIDVLVPRADYDRLIARYRDSREFRLLSPEREKRYRYPFAKLCDRSTEKVEENLDNGVALGVDIDIFPLDAWDTDAEKQAERMGRYIRRLQFWKCQRAISKNPVKRAMKNVLLFLGRPFVPLLVRRMTVQARKNRSGDPALLGCVTWCVYGRREILPASVFSGYDTKWFEDGEYPVPVGWDAYLRSLYGDYAQDPPPERQVSHHRFRAFVWEDAP